ncbi:hypothetical protein GCM10022207_87890 [Streptomyces lannensis]|uniref:Uncharacterized protein n=1 Tax=Streptomyces lannensis TaxID=766498 RepID=A0ABP7LS40_9ACTN
MGVPLEQPLTQFALQISDALAQGGRRHVEPPSRCREVEFLGDRDKISQMQHFHVFNGSPASPGGQRSVATSNSDVSSLSGSRGAVRVSRVEKAGKGCAPIGAASAGHRIGLRSPEV